MEQTCRGSPSFLVRAGATLLLEAAGRRHGLQEVAKAAGRPPRAVSSPRQGARGIFTATEATRFTKREGEPASFEYAPENSTTQTERRCENAVPTIARCGVHTAPRRKRLED